MELCTREASGTVSKASETDKALTEIHFAISGISDKNLQVAAAVEEQSAVAQNMAKNMADIVTTLEDTTESAIRF